MLHWVGLYYNFLTAQLFKFLYLILRELKVRLVGGMTEQPGTATVTLEPFPRIRSFILKLKQVAEKKDEKKEVVHNQPDDCEILVRKEAVTV